MCKIIITDYKGKEIEVAVSAEVFEVFEDSRKQDLRERNEMRRHRDYRGLQNHYVLQELASHENDLELEIMNKLLICRVFEIVKNCTPIQQERFYLYYIYGYTIQEISRFQRCNKSSISRSLQKVLQILRNNLVDGVQQNAEL